LFQGELDKPLYPLIRQSCDFKSRLISHIFTYASDSTYDYWRYIYDIAMAYTSRPLLYIIVHCALCIFFR